MKHHNDKFAQKEEQEQMQEEQEVKQSVQTEDEPQETEEQRECTDTECDKSKQLQDALERVKDLEDKNLRMMAEFDNYRRRTNKEKLELLDTAGERIFTDMLPLIDDFERAKQAMEKTEDIASLREGIELIYSKFMQFLSKNDVHPIDTADADFNTDEHEAITTFAAGEDKKGKIIDCTQKGYKLGEKVIRFAKVVVGE